MAKEIHPSCADCGATACRGLGGKHPDFCMTQKLDEALRAQSLELMRAPENNAMAVAAARNEYEGYCRRSRVEDVLHQAQLMGIRKLGIATCVGLIGEARAMARVLRAHGYEVVGVACKCGEIRKRDIGAPEACEEIGPNICNPILQALLLNREKTQLNLALGLCVGHDSLFYRYSEAFVTTLVAKDRLTGHNPAAPLYQLEGYWKRLLQSDPYLDCPDFSGSLQ